MVEPIFEFVIIAIFVIIVIIEMFLSGRWYPPYFRKGIRIYSKTYVCGSMAQVPVEEVALCEAFKRRLLPSLVFEEIGPGEFDFCGKGFQFSLLSYSQIIHGYLKIDRDSGIIRVVGFLNLGILAFVLSFLMMSHYTFSFMPILVLILGVLYFIQKALYDKVGRFVFEWNSHNWCK